MKRITLLSLLLVMALSVFADTLSLESISESKVVNNGIGLGSILAIVASWSRNKSILWAILHGILSWFYVIYFVFTRSSSEK